MEKIKVHVLLFDTGWHREIYAGGADWLMSEASAAQRVGTSDEIAEAAAFLLGEHARFITGTDLLIDGGVIAAIRTGEYQLG